MNRRWRCRDERRSGRVYGTRRPGKDHQHLELLIRMQQRIGYIDTAKGILILCLLFGHCRILAARQGLDDTVLDVMGAGIGTYRPFFMQTFFLITGFCSTFAIGFWPFLLKNLKTLILPAVLLDLLVYGILALAGGQTQPFGAHLAGFASWLVTGGPWFIFALFWAKILFWCISRLPRPWQIGLVAVLYLLGLTLNHFDWFENYQWHRHALLALPFLFGGYLLKGRMVQIEKYLLPAGLIGIVVIVAENLLAHFTGFILPANDLFIDVGFATFPLQFVNVAGGSALVLWLARKLAGSKIIALLGQGSLLAYLLNEPVQVLVLRLMVPLYPAGRLAGCCCFHVVSYVLCVAVTCLLIWLIYKHRGLSWIVGKF